MRRMVSWLIAKNFLAQAGPRHDPLELRDGHPVHAAADVLVAGGRRLVGAERVAGLHHDPLREDQVDPGESRHEVRVAAVERLPWWVADRERAARCEQGLDVVDCALGIVDVLEGVLQHDQVEAPVTHHLDGVLDVKLDAIRNLRVLLGDVAERELDALRVGVDARRHDGAVLSCVHAGRSVAAPDVEQPGAFQPHARAEPLEEAAGGAEAALEVRHVIRPAARVTPREHAAEKVEQRQPDPVDHGAMIWPA